MTTRLFKWILARLGPRTTYKQLEDETGVDATIISEIDKKRIAEIVANHMGVKAPRRMGVDEIKDGKDILAYFVVDHDTGEVIAFVPDYDTLKAVFGLMPNREECKEFSMDMSPILIPLVHEYFPQATITLDKFHVLEAAKKGFRAALLAESAGIETDAVADLHARMVLPEDPDDVEELEEAVAANEHPRRLCLRNDRYTFLTNHRKLDAKQRAILAGWFSQRPDLKAAYVFLQLLYALWAMGIPSDRALKRFDKLAASLPSDIRKHFRKFLDGVATYRNEVFSYFDTDLTNALCESLARQMRDYIKIHRGAAFEELRAMVIDSYGPGRRKNYIPPPAPALDAADANANNGAEDKTGPPRRYGHSRHRRRRKWSKPASPEQGQLPLDFGSSEPAAEDPQS